MTSHAAPPTLCPNCETALERTYCPECGQKAVPLDPTIHEFLHHLFHELAHFDGKIVQSVRLLLSKPGFLSREYFAGRRIRYISPIRLYLVFSLVYFAVTAFAPGAAVRITVTPDPAEDPRAAETRRQQIQETVNDAVTHWAPRAMFVLVPVFAGLVALAARRSGRNYPQHLYFSLHVHAAWFAAGTVAAAARAAAVPYLSAALGPAASVYGIAYLVLAFRRAYDLRPLGALWRSAAIGVAYSLVVFAVLMTLTLTIMFRD